MDIIYIFFQKLPGVPFASAITKSVFVSLLFRNINTVAMAIASSCPDKRLSLAGVPISTQWGPQGYFYPIQIAQYGLSHYSKYLATKPPDRIVLEDAEDEQTNRWILPDDDTSVDNVQDPIRNTRVIEFNTKGNGSGLSRAEVVLP